MGQVAVAGGTVQGTRGRDGQQSQVTLGASPMALKWAWPQGRHTGSENDATALRAISDTIQRGIIGSLEVWQP